MPLGGALLHIEREARSVLESLRPHLSGYEQLRQWNVAHFLALLIENVVVLEEGQRVAHCSLEELRVDLLHQLRARCHFLLVQEDTLRLFPDLLILYLPLQVHHVALLGEMVHRFFELDISHFVDLAHCELVHLADGAAHLSLLVMLYRSFHFVLPLLDLEDLVARDHVVQDRIRAVLLVLEPLHLPQLLFLRHRLTQFLNVLVLVHFQLRLRNLLRPVIYVEDFGVSLRYSTMVVRQVLVPFLRDHVKVLLLLVELDLLLSLILPPFHLILLHLFDLYGTHHHLLVLLFVLPQPVGCLQYVIVQLVFVLDEALDGAGVLGAACGVGVDLELVPH